MVELGAAAGGSVDLGGVVVGLIAIAVTVLIAAAGALVAAGSLRQQVRQNERRIGTLEQRSERHDDYHQLASDRLVGVLEKLVDRLIEADAAGEDRPRPRH